MPTNWKEAATLERLIAAMYSASRSSGKLDYNEIARFFGQGATYHTIEGYFRKVKKESEKLMGNAPSAPATPSKRAATTPRSKTKSTLNGVANGRVTKQASTPRIKVKKETSPDLTSESPVSINGDLASDDGSVFNPSGGFKNTIV